MSNNCSLDTFRNLTKIYQTIIQDLKQNYTNPLTTNDAQKGSKRYLLACAESQNDYKHNHPSNNNLNNPFIVSDTLVVYSLNPYKSKRIYKKHRLSKSIYPFEIYICEVIDNNFIVTLDSGLVLCGETILEDLVHLVPGFGFTNIHSFFGLTEQKVQAAFYVNHN